MFKNRGIVYPGNEVEIFKSGPHPIVLTIPIITVLLPLTSLIMKYSLFSFLTDGFFIAAIANEIGISRHGLFLIFNKSLIWSTFLALLYLLYSLLVFLNTSYIITNRRIIRVKGIISDDRLQGNFTKFETEHATRDIIGRFIFDYGTIVITSDGGTKNELKKIANFKKFLSICMREKQKAGK